MFAAARLRRARFVASCFILAAAVFATSAAAGNRDKTPPTVSLTAPAAGAVSGTVTLAASASDNVKVASVRFYVDGVQQGTTDQYAPYTATWNAGAASVGTHVLKAVAKDTSGNSTTSAPVSVTVGTTAPAPTPAPTVSLTAPSNGSTVGGTVAVTATAQASSGAVDVSVTVDGTALGSVEAGGWSGTWDTTTLANGSHTVVASAWDAAGNVAKASETVTVSNTVQAPPPPPAPAPSAAQRFLAPTGVDSGSCATATAPCATFDYAYHQATPGDTVAVAGGTYTHAIATGDVILNYDASKVGAAPVTFLAQGSVTVELGSTTTVNHSPDIRGAQNVVFDGVNFLHGSIGIIPQYGSSCGVNANGVTLRNLSINGAISMRNPQNVLVQNVDIGNYTYPDPGVQDAWGDSSRVGDYDCGTRASHVTFDHVRWHNIYRGSSASHAECLFVERSDYVSVVNSRLEACPIMGIFLKNDSGVTDGTNFQDHVLIQNDFISQPCPTGGSAGANECGSHGIQESDCDNNATVAQPASPLTWTIKFDTLGPGASIWICEPNTYFSSASVLEANIADSLSAGCSSVGNWSKSYNVWTGSQAACGNTDKSASAASLFVNPAAFDFHLLAGVAPTVPVAAGCPAVDLDGDARPAATHTSLCDAGADEH